MLCDRKKNHFGVHAHGTERWGTSEQEFEEYLLTEPKDYILGADGLAVASKLAKVAVTGAAISPPGVRLLARAILTAQR